MLEDWLTGPTGVLEEELVDGITGCAGEELEPLVTGPAGVEDDEDGLGLADDDDGLSLTGQTVVLMAMVDVTTVVSV